MRSARSWAAICLAGALALTAVPASGQPAIDPNGPIPPADIPGPGGSSLLPAPPTRGVAEEPPIDGTFGLPSALPDLPEAAAPYAPSELTPDLGLDLAPIVEPQLVLTAKLTEEGGALKSGVVWRVFGDKPGPDGTLPLVAQANGGIASFRLPAGVYLVHGGFGYAGMTSRVEVKAGMKQEQLVLNAGGLSLEAATGEDRTLPSDDIRFDVYAQETDERGERKIVARDVKPGEMVRLGAATYSVVSRYGLINAQTHADVEVKAGKLSKVVLYQKAAEVTLKLVGEPGGEAIADTRWSILTPGGDIVTEGVGAFPSFILASGGYTVVARHAERVYQRDFDVETGRDAEVEVLATAASAVRP